MKNWTLAVPTLNQNFYLIWHKKNYLKTVIFIYFFFKIFKNSKNINNYILENGLTGCVS